MDFQERDHGLDSGAAMMSDDLQFRRITERWQKLTVDGQNICIEELCDEESEECSPALRERLRAFSDAFLAPKTMRHSVTIGQRPEEEDLISKDSKDEESAATHSTDHEAAGTQANDPFKTQAHSSGGELGSDSFRDLSHVFCVTQYENFKFIDRGGLGEVHMATQSENGRDVAIKFIRPDKQTDDKQEMFEIESKITAKLEHPGVVPVYGFGVSTEGRPFYVMRMINGKSMRASIKDFHNRLSREHGRLDHGEHAVEFRELLNRFVSVCKTIGYAHSVGVLHRDLKPQNIMFGQYGETLVVDWGLARPYQRTTEQRDSSGLPTLITETKDKGFAEGIVGTPNYMSPEQADGDAYVGPKTDIYSLGTCLYELITGDLAVQGQSLQSVLSRVRRNDIRHPHEKNPRIPKALAEIAMKSMRADPEERYPTALAIAQDVERYLADEPVEAYQEPLRGQIRRWIRNHWSASQLIAATLLATVAAATAISVSNYQQSKHETERMLNGMRDELSTQSARLEASFKMLKQDVMYLAQLPDVLNIAKAGAQRASATDEMPEVGSDAATMFSQFIYRMPNYMQARIIDKNGIEALRLERQETGGPVSRNFELADKSGRGYFIDTRDLPADRRVLYSRVNINQEKGIKDFKFPVVRASVPIRGQSDEDRGEFLGMVIINMHFDRLAQDIYAKRDKHIFLVNEDHQYLFHPTRSAGFLFDRGIKDFKIDDIYNELADFLTANHTRFDGVCTASCAVIVQPTTPVDPETKRYNGLAGLHRSLMSLVSGAKSQFNASYSVSDVNMNPQSCHAVLKGIDPEDLEDLIAFLEQKGGGAFQFSPLPTLDPTAPHLVHCQKVRLDEDLDRCLTLVMVDTMQ